MAVIRDWTGALCFKNKFETFDDAEEFLTEFLESNELDYNEYRGEYYISIE